jgi:hypothetical protein
MSPTCFYIHEHGHALTTKYIFNVFIIRIASTTSLGFRKHMWMDVLTCDIHVPSDLGFPLSTDIVNN